MKKVLMVVALLLLATPAFATDVWITATVGADINKAEPNWTVPLTIGYTGAAEANSIRAFALVLNTDGGAHLDHIRDYNRGESKVPGGGFGIFPASFRQYITPYNGTDVNSWNNPSYSPLAYYSDPNSGGGNDNVNMVVELGTLFVEPNSPGTHGSLFTVDVNRENSTAKDCNVCITLDQIRGGVIKKDTTAADVCLPAGDASIGTWAGCVNVKWITCTNIPDITGMTKTAADAAITAAGLVPNGTPVATCACAFGTVCTTPTGCVAPGSTVNYNYESGRTVPNIVGMTKAAADAALAAAGLVANGTGSMSCVCTYNTACSQGTAAGTCVANGSTVNYSYETGRTVPNIVGMTQAAGCTALTNAGLCCGTVTTKYSDTVAAGIVISQGTASGTCVANGTCVTCVVSLGRFPTPTQIIYPKWDSDACVPIYWSPVAGATGYQLERSANSGSTWTATVYTGTATYKGDPSPLGANFRYRVLAKNADSTSLYLTGTFDCNAYLSTCYRNGATTDPNWANWLSAGRPDCWCKASTAQEPNGSGYQCDGDADGATSGAPNNYRVYTGDLSMVTGNWKKVASALTADPNVTLAGKLKITSACADVDHKSSGAPNNYRVYTGDLSIVTGNWKKLNSSSVTATNKLLGNCPR